LKLDPIQTGRFLGGSIHDVAQVVAAGYASSLAAGDAATIVKLMRVAMLLPTVLIITLIYAQRGGAAETDPDRRKVSVLPSFLVAFVALAALNAFHAVPAPVTSILIEASKWLLVISVAALGMKASLRNMMAVGAPALALIAAETLFLGLLVLGWILLGR